MSHAPGRAELFELLHTSPGILACITALVTYVTEQAYVFVAISGKGFCPSAWAVAGLVASHPLQCAVNAFMNKLLMFLVLVIVPTCIYLATLFLHNGLFSVRDCKCANKKEITEDLKGCFNYELFGDEGYTIPLFCAALSLLIM